jgi:adenine-specific DNA methylase
MLKRLIEVALPLKEVSEQSAREKSIRHGHISTLHIWWARRPLAACRAAVFASLIPDPDDPECPEDFRKLVMELLKQERYRPNGTTDYTDGTDGKKKETKVEDTPRNRCLEFIKHLVKWENSNKAEFIEPARKLIAAAHKFLHPGAEGDQPKVLDPFAGGGAIPLEALRLGCEAHAIDLNPVAHLIELCTLVYPQEYGQPDSRPVPDYIHRLIQRRRAKSGESRALFSETDTQDPALDSGLSTLDSDIIPDVEITEAEYRKNPLAADVKYWAAWVRESAFATCKPLYTSKAGEVPIVFFWARTLVCPNPTCRQAYPLVTGLILAKRRSESISLSLETEKGKIVIGLGSSGPNNATMNGGSSACPSCTHPLSAKDLRQHGVANNGFSEMLLAVAFEGRSGPKRYAPPTQADHHAWEASQKECSSLPPDAVPNEVIANVKGRFNIYVYGYRQWGALFNARQKVALAAFGRSVKSAHERVSMFHPSDYGAAVASLLTCVPARQIDYCSRFCRWVADGEFVAATLGGEKKLPMIWDYAEVNPFGGGPGDWRSAVDWVLRVVRELSWITKPATVFQGDARRLPFSDQSLDCIVTDPPYYSAIPYSDLSDFFYTWERRTVATFMGTVFRTPVTPKRAEITEMADLCDEYKFKDKAFFEDGMRAAFQAWHLRLREQALTTVVFAHKTTTAWDALIGALLSGGFCPVASWPIHTERPGRNQSNNKAALASSFFIVCRKRPKNAGGGLWDDVRKELQQVAQERLDFFWSQGIRGADFFISAIGPALSVFGKYERVTKLSGEEVTVGQFLDEVRGLVTNYALNRILYHGLHGSHGSEQEKNISAILAIRGSPSSIDPESRFYVVWKWSYGDAKVPADESFKLAQALGMDTELMWDRTGILEKSGENVAAVPVAKRMKVKDLGEPAADGSPASLIDVLHRLCVFREKGDTDGMAEFLATSGQANNPALWLVAQATSEILPDGDKEKQLMQGLLNQREKLEQAKGMLF